MDRRSTAELVRHVAASTGLPPATAARVVADVVAFFAETTDEFVRRRHRELRHRGYRNEHIWTVLSAELESRPVVAEALSQRQLRRIVYG